jgi:hypothetical protein
MSGKMGQNGFSAVGSLFSDRLQGNANMSKAGFKDRVVK